MCQCPIVWYAYSMYFSSYKYNVCLNGYITIYRAESSGLSLYTTEHADEVSTIMNNAIYNVNDNIVLINTNYYPVYCNCFKVD